MSPLTLYMFYIPVHLYWRKSKPDFDLERLDIVKIVCKKQCLVNYIELKVYVLTEGLRCKHLK